MPIRMSSDSMKDVVAKDQQVPVAAWFLTGVVGKLRGLLGRELVQEPAEDVVPAVEPVEEEPPDAVDVRHARRLERVEARLRQDCVDAASVVYAVVPLDEPVAFKPVDEAGDAAAREQQAVGQLGHPQAVPRRPDELVQHLERGQREPALGAEILVEPADDRRVGLDETAPEDALLA